MRRATSWLVGTAAVAIASSAGAQAAAAPSGAPTAAAAAGPAAASQLIATGRAAFGRVCAPCHAKGAGLDGSPMLPGAAALAAKHQGAVSPYLEERGDLTVEVLRTFVRQGSGAMPMFRKTEISDAEIAALATYFRATAAAAVAAP